MTRKQIAVGQTLKHQIMALETQAIRFGFVDTETALKEARRVLSRQMGEPTADTTAMSS